MSATDPSTFAAVTGLLILAALAASYVPARRALGIEPAAAIKGEQIFCGSLVFSPNRDILSVSWPPCFRRPWFQATGAPAN